MLNILQKELSKQDGIDIPMCGVETVKRLLTLYVVSQAQTIYLAINPPYDNPITLNLVLLKLAFYFNFSQASLAYVSSGTKTVVMCSRLL